MYSTLESHTHAYIGTQENPKLKNIGQLYIIILL